MSEKKKDCRDCKYFVGCEKAIWVGPCDEFKEKNKEGREANEQ